MDDKWSMRNQSASREWHIISLRKWLGGTQGLRFITCNSLLSTSVEYTDSNICVDDLIVIASKWNSLQKIINALYFIVDLKVKLDKCEITFFGMGRRLVKIMWFNKEKLKLRGKKNTLAFSSHQKILYFKHERKTRFEKTKTSHNLILKQFI